MRSIQDEWKANAPILVPAAASPVQREQTQLAFYAGAQAVLRLMWNVGADEVSEEAGASILQGLHEECDEFARDWATLELVRIASDLHAKADAAMHQKKKLERGE